MQPEASVFEKSYQYYLNQFKGIPLPSKAGNLGAKINGKGLTIPLLGNDFTVSAEGIIDPAGKRPSYDTCVILSKYVIMCPDAPPRGQ